MPRFSLRVDPDFDGNVTVSLSPGDATDTNDFGPFCCGQGVFVMAGARKAADSVTATCTGDTQAPALDLQALDDQTVFQVQPAPPTGPSVFTLNAADAPAVISAGGAGTATYTVSIMTYAYAQGLGLVP